MLHTLLAPFLYTDKFVQKGIDACSHSVVRCGISVSAQRYWLYAVQLLSYVADSFLGRPDFSWAQLVFMSGIMLLSQRWARKLDEAGESRGAQSWEAIIPSRMSRVYILLIKGIGWLGICTAIIDHEHARVFDVLNDVTWWLLGYSMRTPYQPPPSEVRILARARTN